MAAIGSIIETGVDKLVKLVKERARISMEDAAKESGVSLTVIEEWADFLEEEGVISIEYKLTKPFLVERKLTKTEITKKVKEFAGKKEVFIRKAEGTLGFLEKEGTKLKSAKKEFDENKIDNLLSFLHKKMMWFTKDVEKEKKIRITKESSKKFKKLFDNKMRVTNLIEKVNKDRDDLEKELIEVIKKAKSFNLASKSVDIGKQMLNLEKKFKEVDKKKNIFEKEFKKLSMIIKK